MGWRGGEGRCTSMANYRLLSVYQCWHDRHTIYPMLSGLPCHQHNKGYRAGKNYLTCNKKFFVKMLLYYKNLCIFGVLVLNPFFLWHFMGDNTNIDTLTESCKYQIVLSSSSLGYTYNWYKKSFQTRKIPVGLSHGNYRNSIVEIEKKGSCPLHTFLRKLLNIDN